MLTRILRTVRLDTIDNRSQVGVALRRLREELIAQLGGPSEVTPTQLLLIEEIAKKAVIVRATGEYILAQEMPVQDGALLAVVMQHDRLQATLAGLLDRLGWERRAKQLDLASQLAALHTKRPDPEPTPATG
ncbi:MAG: hypothetical protein KIT14_12550 [bacterium]|nr:hypothetical protein [bacterium]